MSLQVSNDDASSWGNGSSCTEEGASGDSPTADLGAQMNKYRDCLQLLHSRLHLLNCLAKGPKGAGGQDEGKDSLMLSGAVHALQQASLSSFLAAKTVHQLIDNPPSRTDPTLRQESYMRLQERLGLMLRGDEEISRLRAKLRQQRLQQQQEQLEAVEDRDVFLRTLKDAHAARDNPQNKDKQRKLAVVSRKATRTNFIRTLVVMLVKSSGVRLSGERGKFLIALLHRFCRPVTMKELQE